jgi:hypothetical protein
MNKPRQEPVLGPAEETTPANPFLTNMAGAPRAPAPPRKPAPPEAAPDSRPTARPRRVARSPSYQLVSRPGVESPDIKDAHREFRRGGWGKFLGLAGLAALILGGLTWLVKPAPKEAVPFEKLYSPPQQEQFAIGTSLPPDRIPEPKIRQTADKTPSERQEAAERPSGIVPQKQFANEFKSSAKKSSDPKESR